MSRNLNYCRMILQKVSFDRDLFNKELSKANQYLSQEDYRKLKLWLEGFYQKNDLLYDASATKKIIN